MKKLFKRFAPLLLALVMVLGSCLTVSAAEYDSSDQLAIEQFEKYISDNELSFGTDYKLYWVSSGSKYLLLTSAPLKMGHAANGADNLISSASLSYIWFTYSGGSVVINRQGSLSGPDASLFSPGSISKLVVNYDFKSSDGSLYKSADSSGFFPTPPPLVAAVKGVDLTVAQREVILLIPLSILYLVGYRGLQKGLQILSTLLRRA